MQFAVPHTVSEIEVFLVVARGTLHLHQIKQFHIFDVRCGKILRRYRNGNGISLFVFVYVIMF